ncbi:MAG TPA: fibronectin type III domain-containing protein [Candidatus Saccharimonadales bacterium]|nr:fibronectin type III domain-containing protein [Candidatus Saccharimonadales bacterium]
MAILKKRTNSAWRILSGAPSNVVSSTSPSAVAASSPTAGTLRVTWTAPSNTGNADILHYTVKIRVDGDITNTVVATSVTNGNDLETLVTGLTNGTTYRAYVLATNSGGNSPESTQSNAATVTSATTYTLPSGMVIPSGWDNPKTTGIIGAGMQYGDLTPYVGNLTTTANNQVIQNLDIRGNITVRHNNVTVQHCRIHSVQTSNVLTGGESIVDGNQSTVDGGGNRTWLANNMAVRYCEVIGSLDPNLNDQSGICIGGGDGMVADHCHIHNVSDSLLPSGNSSVTHNLVYDVKVATGSHADCIQIIDGDNALIQDNTLLALTPGVTTTLGGDGVTRIPKLDSVGNSVVQIGAQTGELLNLTINHNYMSGGIYTINSNNTNEGTYGAITGAYTNNVFSGYFHYGPVANFGSGMTFDNSNVWEATRETGSWYNVNDSSEKYWHLNAGSPVNGTTTTTTP